MNPPSRRSFLLPTAIAFLTVAGLIPSASGADYSFESQYIRLTLGDDATPRALVDLRSGRNLLAPKPGPFAYIVNAQGKVPATRITVVGGGIYQFSFGSTGVTADYSIQQSSDTIEIALTRVSADDLKEISLARLTLIPGTSQGNWLAGVTLNDFVVCLTALQPDVYSRIEANALVASSYISPGFGKAKVALVGVPVASFPGLMQRVERRYGLSSPTLNGTWAKISPELKGSYLFADLNENNADALIALARAARMTYILIYNFTWSSSDGSYPINLVNFPHGEDGLHSVVAKCHRAGLKVGLHTLTATVSGTDPLALPTPDPRLFRTSMGQLASDLDTRAGAFGAVSSAPMQRSTDIASVAAGVSTEGSSVQPAALEVQIGNEILHCSSNRNGTFNSLTGCVHGVQGTTAATHPAGSAVYVLHKLYGNYLADLRTSLKDQIAARIAGIVNRCEFDMVYFDAGESSAALAPSWYWEGALQQAIFDKIHRDVIVEGSGMTHWMWHIYTRGVCDDFSALALREYLDDHKIPERLRLYQENYLPAELGWFGWLVWGPDRPASSPDDIDIYGIRMLAFDVPFSLETDSSTLRANLRTEEAFQRISMYEQVRLSGSVPTNVRRRLENGTWRLIPIGKSYAIVKTELQSLLANNGMAVKVVNPFAEQSIKFHLEVLPNLAQPGTAINKVLWSQESAPLIPAGGPNAAMPGALAVKLPLPGGAKTVDLSNHRGLAITLVNEEPASAKAPPAVLNIQLESGVTLRDYYVDLNFTGERTIVVREPDPARMLREFKPDLRNYDFKFAIYTFDYSHVTGIALRWMRRDSAVWSLKRIEGLTELPLALKDVGISFGGASLKTSATLASEDYLEFSGDGTLRAFDRKGTLLATSRTASPMAHSGINDVSINSATPALFRFTTEFWDQPVWSGFPNATK